MSLDSYIADLLTKRVVYIGAVGARMPRAVRIACAASACLIAGSLASTAVGAQASPSEPPPAVSVGARVRLWELATHDVSIPIVGHLTSITSERVEIQPDHDDSTVRVPRTAVTHIDLSLGRQTASRATRGALGAVIGALGGGVLGVIAGNMSRSNAARLGIYSGIAGLGVGGAVGALTPGEAWRPATLPPAPQTITRAATNSDSVTQPGASSTTSH